jgi:hypothetical protein
LLAVPDRRTWFGRRDHAFILMAVQTGLRLYGDHRGQTRRPRPWSRRSCPRHW